MADASQTYRRGIAQPAGPRFERYLGVFGAAVAILGAVAFFGSDDAVWHHARTLLGSIYLFVTAVVS